MPEKAISLVMPFPLTICLGFWRWHREHLRRSLESLVSIECPVHLVIGDDEQVFDLLPPNLPVTVLSRPLTIWSRSFVLNEAARKAETPYLCFTDADMIFPSSWMPTVLSLLSPRRLLLTDSRDLTQGHPAEFDDESLLRASRPHSRVGQGGGMVVSRDWFLEIGGFDEYYKIWGCEDNDLAGRALWDGLETVWLPNTFVAHQEHARDWPTQEQFAYVERNRAYFLRTREERQIVRNGGYLRW